MRIPASKPPALVSLLVLLVLFSAATVGVAADCDSTGTSCCICHAPQSGTCGPTFGGGYGAYYNCYNMSEGCANGTPGCFQQFCDPYYAPGC